jgi:hypothetical protein
MKWIWAREPPEKYYGGEKVLNSCHFLHKQNIIYCFTYVHIALLDKMISAWLVKNSQSLSNPKDHYHFYKRLKLGQLYPVHFNVLSMYIYTYQVFQLTDIPKCKTKHHLNYCGMIFEILTGVHKIFQHVLNKILSPLDPVTPNYWIE